MQSSAGATTFTLPSHSPTPSAKIPCPVRVHLLPPSSSARCESNPRVRCCRDLSQQQFSSAVPARSTSSNSATLGSNGNNGKSILLLQPLDLRVRRRRWQARGRQGGVENRGSDRRAGNGGAANLGPQGPRISAEFSGFRVHQIRPEIPPPITTTHV